ncbi:MAG: response regulator transcription factor [Oscillospiraceae bacterium]|nr:response regulator transcription factor [Oscillospiraceae bacterium]
MKVLIVDDDPLIRKSLSLMLGREADIAVVGTATHGAEAFEMCGAHLPDVVLMDIRMPNVDGIAATRLIKQAYPQVRIMMLTTFDDKPNIQQALTAGADGYLLKTDEIAAIAGKLRPLVEGMGVLDPKVLRKLTAPENPALEELTQRERDIVRLVAQGLSNKEIAAQLFLGEGTVRNNIVTIMEKLDVKNRTQLGMAFYGK